MDYQEALAIGDSKSLPDQCRTMTEGASRFVGDVPRPTIFSCEQGDVNGGSVLCTEVVSHRCGFRGCRVVKPRTLLLSRPVRQGNWRRTMSVG